MYIKEGVKRSLCILNNPNIANNNAFKQLTENCFSVLKGKTEIHSMNILLGSKPNIIKDCYAALLSASAEFVRQGANEEEVAQYLLEECNFPQDKIKSFVNVYSNSKQDVEIALLNVGTYLPHLTDVDWKIDYIVKSSLSDESSGPLIRVSLLSEAYDKEMQGKKIEHIDFTCTTQELQDLVYKLKDAVRHCQHIATEH